MHGEINNSVRQNRFLSRTLCRVASRVVVDENSVKRLVRSLRQVVDAHVRDPVVARPTRAVPAVDDARVVVAASRRPNHVHALQMSTRA